MVYFKLNKRFDASGNSLCLFDNPVEIVDSLLRIYKPRVSYKIHRPQNKSGQRVLNFEKIGMWFDFETLRRYFRFDFIDLTYSFLFVHFVLSYSLNC